MIDRFERFSFAIAELSRYWHKIASDEMVKYGLKGSHALYLTTIYRYPDGVTASQLSELCSKDKSDVSRSMSLLIKRGFVCKVGGHTRRYRPLLVLTEEGRNAAEMVQRAALTAVDLAGQGISDEEREVFYGTLDRIAANLHDIADTGLEDKAINKDAADSKPKKRRGKKDE